ncbi:Odorant receptor 007 [Nylanderia fulva]|uniref:Odorant receptor n=1 Tax=Nylanderia fulva TaxID=613905 RepID=A0A6G1LQP4_9HYME|nr:odorant receptor Or1-like [Nylanderia fulva]KAF3054595.1 Odorant receptor 007 [Nylanderia fulva]
MQLLSLNFLLYTISGLWRPIEWTSKCSKYLYGLYTFTMMYLLIFSVIIQLMDIILVIDNVDDFTTTSLLFLSDIACFCKATTIIIRRDKIINLIKTLQEKPCKPSSEEEINIQMEYDNLIRTYSINYSLLASFSCTGVTIGEIFATLQGELPYRGWVPYDVHSSLVLFWITSIQEILAIIVGTIMNVATETLILGFCLQICSQLEILKHRFRIAIKSDEEEESPSKNVLYKKSRFSEHIRYHLCIIRFAETFNEIFNQVLFMQFSASILVLCTSLYYLSSHITFEDFVKLAVYTLCMFVQIFVYCWAGNEVILKSTGLSEAMYEINWTSVTVSEQKDLLIIMKRCTKPIKFTSTFLVTLSLESYTNILRTSYSAFNVLQQS